MWRRFTTQRKRAYIFDLLTNPVEILTDENDWVNGMCIRKMELGEPDASGRRTSGRDRRLRYTIDVDTVIMSLGTSPNPLISSTTDGLEIKSGNASLRMRATERPPRKAYTPAVMP